MSIGRIQRIPVLAPVLFILAGLLLSACGNGKVTPPVGFQFDVFRETAQVSVGQSEPLAVMTNKGPASLPEGHKVSTDSQGEALLKGDLGSKTCSIFVFANGSLTKSPCPKASSTGGNTSCQTGSAVYKDCDALLIQTPSMQAFQVGTWSWVTYLPDQQVSVVLTSDGNTQVRPVRDADQWDLVDEPMDVPAGSFLYTAPDNRMREVAGLPMREALPWEELPALLGEYPELQPWMERAFDRARQDDVPMPDPNDMQGGPDQQTGTDLLGGWWHDPLVVLNQGENPAVAVPLYLRIVNGGSEPVSGFEVAIIARSFNDEVVQVFPVDQPVFQDQIWEWSGEVVLEGDVLRSNPLVLTAYVDYCPEDPGSQCRIPEVDEGNNAIEDIVFDLPPDLFQPSGPPGPDLTARIEVLGTSQQDPDRPGTLFLPVRVRVTNQGDQPADVFKVAVEGASPNGTFVYAFSVEGQQDQWYPYSQGPLPPGEQVSFQGWVLLNAETAPEVIQLTAIADSCSGEEFYEPYCRVDESNEENNRSEPVDAPVY